MLQRILTPWRLRVYPTAALAGVTVGFIVFIATSDGLRTLRGGRLGGDFPAFYAAGKFLQAGTPKLIYSQEALRDAERDLLPGVEDGWLTFAYPPYVAAAYVPFALMPFKAAYLAYTGVMVLSCIVALWLLRPLCPPLARYFLPCAAAALTFYPLFRANVGGQNTAISLLCAAGTTAALGQGRHASAGLWLAAWLFKPQFALPAIAIILVAGHWRILPTLAAGATLWYAIGAAVAGADWPLWWVRHVVAFASEDLAVDSGMSISFREWAAHIGTLQLGWILAAIAGLSVAAVVWKYGHSPDRALPVVAAAASVAVLTAPHAMFYDGGLAVLGVIAAGAFRGALVSPHAVGLWLLALAQVLRAYLPVPPLTIATVLALLMSLQVLRSRALMPIATTAPDEGETDAIDPSNRKRHLA